MLDDGSKQTLTDAMALSKKQKALFMTLALGLVQAAVGPVTLRDLAQRSDDQVRGPRLLWRVWGGSNLAGAASYWLFGRKRAAGAHV